MGCSADVDAASLRLRGPGGIMVEGGQHVHVAAPSPSLVLDTSRDG